MSLKSILSDIFVYTQITVSDAKYRAVTHCSSLPPCGVFRFRRTHNPEQALLVERQIPHIHQNRSVFEASMKLCIGVDPPKGSWKKIPPTYSHPLVDAILKFNMAAILGLFSAITRKLRQVETFCLLLTPHFQVQ